MTAEDRELRRRPARRLIRPRGVLVERRVEIDAALSEQTNAAEHVVVDGPAQLVLDHLRGRLHLLTHALAPRAAVALAETELEQQLQVLGARPELAVVEALRVVGVGATFQEQARQRLPVRMRRLIALAAAEHARQ